MGNNNILSSGRPWGWAIARRMTSLLVAMATVAVLIQPTTEPAHGALAATRLDWGSKPSMPTGRQNHSLAAAPNGKLYAVGGFAASNAPLTTFDEYDPATNVWTPRSGMPTARGALGLAAAPNGKLYAVGGSDDTTGNPGKGTVEEYDPATNQWNTLPLQSMPTPRSYLGLAAASNGKLYAIGGLQSGTSTTPLNTVEEYDPATNTWTNCGGTPISTLCRPMPAARIGLGVVAAPNGKLYAVGGTTGGPPTGTVYEYDPATNTWTNCGGTCQAMPTARTWFGLAAASNGKLYAVGGNTHGAFPIADTGATEEYDPATNQWNTVPLPSLPNPRDRLALAAAPNGKLYAVGGESFGGNGDVPVDEYDPIAKSWADKPAVDSLPVGLQFAASAVFQGRIYVFGGLGGTSPQIKNTVYEYTPPANGVGLGTWRSDLTVMPTPRYGAAAVLASNNAIYVVGGVSASASCPPSGICRIVEAFTPPANGVGAGSWSGAPSIQQLNAARALPGLALATSNNKLYVAGGISSDGSTNLETVEEYDPIANTVWRTVASMTQKRQGLALALAGDSKLYAVGGIDGGNLLTTVERFTVPPTTATTGSWAGPSGVAQLPIARGNHGMVASYGNLFVVGGRGPESSGLVRSEVFELDPAANGGVGIWSVNTILANQPIRAPMPTARFAHTVAVAGSNLYAIGGTTDGSNYQTLVQRAVLTRLPGASAGGPYTVSTGQIQLNATGSDPDGNPLTFAWDIGGGLFFNVNGQSPILTVGLPNGTYPVYVRALDSNGGYGVSSKTTLAVITCHPRPNVQVQTVKLGPGQVRATLTAGGGSFSGNLSLGLPSASPPRNVVNARVDVQGGPQNITTNATVPVTGTQVILTIARVNPGAVMVPLSISDGCGAWNSFVGFGTGV